MYYKNNSQNIWTKFISFEKYIFPKTNKSKNYIIADGEKCFTVSLKTKKAQVSRFVFKALKNIYWHLIGRFIKMVQIVTCDKLKKVKINLSEVSKERYSNIYHKQLFSVSTNGGPYERCASSLADMCYVSLPVMMKHIAVISVIPFIKK